VWRSVNGLDYNRSCTIIAILDKRTSLNLSDRRRS
jgi:predicted ATP-dependent serine protease